MAKINLSEEDLKMLSESVNNETEIPQELLLKLAPSFFDKLNQQGQFDFEKLQRFKIPILEYAGKRSEAVILAQANLSTGAAPLQVVRKFGNGNEEEWRNLIVQGDNLQFLKTCYLNKDPLIKDKVKGKVKLIYIDPPFGTGDEYGGKNGEMSYSAKMMGSEFIENLRERLIYLRELLRIDGVITIRMGYNFGHYIKIILDEIFDKGNLINEIVVNRGKQRLGGSKRYVIAYDHLFCYSKTISNYYFNKFTRERYEGEADRTNLIMKGQHNQRDRVFIYEGEKIILRSPDGKHWKFSQKKINEMTEKGIIYFAKSRHGLNSGIKIKQGDCFSPTDIVPSYIFDEKKAIDSNWTDIPGYTQETGYPTENSELLLERVIKSFSEEEDLILDCFAGSGTTGAVAEKLRRRWIMCDFGKHAIYTMQKRIWQIGESKKLGLDVKKNEKYGIPPKPFAILSAGAYDFSKIINLRKNREAYINFVLGLFGIVSEDKDYTSKYKLNNIYAEKENNPVEIFPIWDDDYLKNIKIDEVYLKEIVNAAGSKLKGDYYIITPETCTVVGNTFLKNSNNDDVNFILLKFPYKLLEDFSRQMQIEEQPDSQDSINKLISSSGFYFNEEVKIKISKLNNGFQITDLETNILDRNNHRFKGIDGLSMLLIDKNYDGKVFNLDAAIYQKDISEKGIINISGLSLNSAVIAIDKHGNESKITYIS